MADEDKEETPLDPVQQATSLKLRANKTTDLLVLRRQYQEHLASLDNLGVEYVESILSTGTLPMEFCINNGVPPLVFQDWLFKNFTPDRMEQIRDMAAEAMVFRAQSALTVSPGTGPQATIIKAYSDLMMKLAERMAPGTWAPPKAADPPPPPVTIQIQGNIPGMEALGAKVINAVTPSASESHSPHKTVTPSHAHKTIKIPDIEAEDDFDKLRER